MQIRPLIYHSLKIKIFHHFSITDAICNKIQVDIQVYVLMIM